MPPTGVCRPWSGNAHHSGSPSVKWVRRQQRLLPQPTGVGPTSPCRVGFQRRPCACRGWTYHLQPQGAWPAHCLWPSVSLQLRWPSLKFQLLWGHPALSPTNAPSPKSQPPLRRTQVSSALTRDQEKFPPASGSPQEPGTSEQGQIGSPPGRQPQGPLQRGPQRARRDPGPAIRRPAGTITQVPAPHQSPEWRRPARTPGERGGGAGRTKACTSFTPPPTAHRRPLVTRQGLHPLPRPHGQQQLASPKYCFLAPPYPALRDTGRDAGGEGGRRGQAEWTPRNGQDTAG